MPPTEIYRSSRLPDCEQRAFVLQAVGIASETVKTEHGYSLLVGTDAAPSAIRHLRRYDAENAVVEPSPPHLKLHSHAWFTPFVLLVVMLGVGYFAGNDTFYIDWYATGSLRSAVPQSGEWWRLITALTLHADVAHLLGNLGFGAFFGYLAARLVGSGIAWLSIVIAATLGNLLDSVFMPIGQVSIGASTAVFATLGLVAAFSWRQQMSRRMRWAHRWAPLVAGISLLGLLGAGGEHVDVLAHLTGFFCGTVLGGIYARVPKAFFDNVVMQWLAAVTGTALFVGAWSWALASAHPGS